MPEKEYIDREAVLSKFLEYGIGWGAAKVKGVINSIPAADVRPVVKAIWVEEEKDGEWHECCSNCREHIPKGKWGQPWHSSYCPHCGAEMER